ncbi:PREDICTED: pancreatic triacylglycerol lipase-like [Ceratosolen solmsi marchali]|uniref:phospholipase A1 n=1 Tax=Ceratosolen solmsi marchali TaxID=326594 RepID=A0AAJ7DW44_9HYME|nr:PREDICTED: pancreatic triacylglycerol lipase-like [Ceratosolen solmsi marchali]
MRIHVETNLLLVLIINAFVKIECFKITGDDLSLLNSNDGLWVFDDNEEIVRATADIPNDLLSSLISMNTHVRFYLYTRNLTGNYESITIGDVQSLKLSTFDATRETKFFAHGWMNSKSSKSCRLVREAYLVYGDFNVIIVDWSKIAKGTYIWSAMHVVQVGKHVAKMIDFLEEQGINLNTTSLSGHSLGAHVVGLAGYYAKNKVNYIVGLDPALPLFSFAGVGSRISTEDAKQVEIIHTNAGFLGFLAPIGDADFYPNGGKRQVGCSIDFGGSCSHSRSYEFFAESIVSAVGFYGMNCKNYSSFVHGDCEGNICLMGGDNSNLISNGTYYLGTGTNYPYAKGIE